MSDNRKGEKHRPDTFSKKALFLAFPSGIADCCELVGIPRHVIAVVKALRERQSGGCKARPYATLPGLVGLSPRGYCGPRSDSALAIARHGVDSGCDDLIPSHCALTVADSRSPPASVEGERHRQRPAVLAGLAHRPQPRREQHGPQGGRRSHSPPPSTLRSAFRSSHTTRSASRAD